MIPPSTAQPTSVISTAITRAAVTKPPNTPIACCGIAALLSVLLTTDCTTSCCSQRPSRLANIATTSRPMKLRRAQSSRISRPIAEASVANDITSPVPTTQGK